MPRLFVALPLPEEVNAVLRRLCSGLPGARWTGDDGFHLTLAFLGEVEEPAARRAEDGLSLVRGPVLDLRLAGLGHFPPRGQPAVLWAGLRASAPLGALVAAIRSRLRRLGLPCDDRRFLAHVTLARLDRTSHEDLARHREAHGGLDGPDFAVRAFVLYESVLGRSGAVHRPRIAVPLA